MIFILCNTYIHAYIHIYIYLIFFTFSAEAGNVQERGRNWWFHVFYVFRIEMLCTYLYLRRTFLNIKYCRTFGILSSNNTIVIIINDRDFSIFEKLCSSKCVPNDTRNIYLFCTGELRRRFLLQRPDCNIVRWKLNLDEYFDLNFLPV